MPGYSSPQPNVCVAPEVDESELMCVDTTQPAGNQAQQNYLCINTNATDPDAGVSAGHSWLTSLPANGDVHSYGAWPSSGTGDVHTDWERIDEDAIAEYDENPDTISYCHPVSDEDLAALEEQVAEDSESFDWWLTDNCASWATDTFSRITGIDFSADDLGALGVETPRALADDIAQHSANQGGAAPYSSGGGGGASF